MSQRYILFWSHHILMFIFYNFSVGVRAFVIELSQISSFISYLIIYWFKHTIYYMKTRYSLIKVKNTLYIIESHYILILLHQILIKGHNVLVLSGMSPYFAHFYLAETAFLLECTSEWVHRKRCFMVYSGFLYIAQVNSFLTCVFVIISRFLASWTFLSLWRKIPDNLIKQ